MSYDPADSIIPGVVSNCCGGAVLLGGLCLECGEHCECEGEDDEPQETEFIDLTKPLSPMDNYLRNDEHSKLL